MEYVAITEIPDEMPVAGAIAIRDKEVQEMILGFLTEAARCRVESEKEFADVVERFGDKLLTYVLCLSSMEYQKGIANAKRTRRFKKQEDGKWHIEFELGRRK